MNNILQVIACLAGQVAAHFDRNLMSSSTLCAVSNSGAQEASRDDMETFQAYEGVFEPPSMLRSRTRTKDR